MRGRCYLRSTVNTLNVKVDRRWESLETTRYPAGRAVSDVTSAHPCQVPFWWKAGSVTTKYLLMQRKISNVSFVLAKAFWGSILLIIFWNSSNFSRLFLKKVLTLGHVYWFSRERKEGRDRDKHQCDRETLIGCFPKCPNQDRTLNLV